ncbi:hypothetical protein K2173_019682 [Erythroxylum novogranatense]|uniref:Chlorophyll a-b binding protein, chloroplastic n=1 Tax=Erythroxylum novogranatense TaxID=1862640 RepID=A0AAV8SM69_9ROSI|nr:hypothetical protein K2173_019682 [Erythroxylum novogranatense]
MATAQDFTPSSLSSRGSTENNPATIETTKTSFPLHSASIQAHEGHNALKSWYTDQADFRREENPWLFKGT